MDVTNINCTVGSVHGKVLRQSDMVRRTVPHHKQELSWAQDPAREVSGTFPEQA